MPPRWPTRWLALPAGLVVATMAGVAGCQPASSSPAASAKPTPPASLPPGHPKEADLATVTLTPDAERRLGIALVAAERKPVPRTTLYGGDVVIPPGRLVSVASPFVGTLKAPPGPGVPAPGSPVGDGQPVFILVPLLSPEARATMAPLLIEANGQVDQAQKQLRIAKVDLDRQENLVRDRLGGSGTLVDAKARYDLAQAQLKAAENRREILAKVASDASSGALSTQTIASPAAGLLQNVHARPGQAVATGALLFDVASLDRVWVKVPVYVGDLERVAADREAVVGGLADAPGAPARAGKPVAAPPSGDPLAATVHLFYEVDNRDGSLRPGQRVGVTLPLRGEERSLVVPRAALLRDIHGGTWVYEKTGPLAYARRRVSVDRVVGDLAALDGGAVKPGAQVVTDGAAELFGAEFGGGK